MCQHRSALQFLFMIVELFFLNSFVDDGIQCAREIVKLNFAHISQSFFEDCLLIAKVAILYTKM